MDIINFFTRIKCPKIVRPNKLERFQTNDQVWWSNKCKELEAGVKVPPYRKLSELKEVFSNEELYNLTIAGLEYEDDVTNIKRRSTKKGPCFKIKRKTFRSPLIANQKSKCLIPTKRYSLKKPFFTDKIIEFCQQPRNEADCWTLIAGDNFSIDSLSCISKAGKVEIMLAENFEKFFNRSKSQISIKGVETDFASKAKKIEKKLAANFEEYFNNIETVTPITIDKETILNIFEVNNSLQINKGIFINIQELPTVPEGIALYLGDANLATTNVLQKEINSDLIAVNSKPMIHAFGTMLPPSIRRFKSSSTDAIKYIQREIKHEHLRTFAAVFEGILELETSQRFVWWLRNHREVNPPEYLLDNCFKMKTSKKFVFYRHRRSHLSRCSQCSVDSVSEESTLQIMV